VLNQWDVLSALDGAWPLPDPDVDPVEMATTPEAACAIAQRLERWDVPAGARLIVLHVSAGNPFRRWPESAFAALAAALVTPEPSRWLLITSGPSDRAAAARVVDAARRQAAGLAAMRIVDAEGLSLAELRALFDRTSVYVGGDSGPLHVAATSAVAIVGLYGPTLPQRSAPWRPGAMPAAAVDAGHLPCRPCDQRRCAPGDFRCLTGIDAATVAAEAERLLELKP
jgi:ADP-heptose:LPS heptosyltransferase